MSSQSKLASLTSLIKKRLEVDVVKTPGETGQFDVYVNGKKIAQRGGNWLSRKLGAGYPDLDGVVKMIEDFSPNE